MSNLQKEGRKYEARMVLRQKFAFHVCVCVCVFECVFVCVFLIPKWCQTSMLLLISCAVNPGPYMKSLQVQVFGQIEEL